MYIVYTYVEQTVDIEERSRVETRVYSPSVVMLRLYQFGLISVVFSKHIG